MRRLNKMGINKMNLIAMKWKYLQGNEYLRVLPAQGATT